MRKVMIISNGGYIPDIIDEINNFLDNKRILFIHYSKKNPGTLIERVKGQFPGKIDPIGEFEDTKQAVESADAIMVSGGNTFLLLKTLEGMNLLEVLREKILNGTPYVGYSAGSNILCPNIRTTNDMPIVEPNSLNALNIVPFNLNPHFMDPIKGMPGETREERIVEFLENNDNRVVGLREFSYLEVIGDDVRYFSREGVRIRIFENGKEPYELSGDDDLNFLLE